ncbi:hypothetical protein DIPPA_64938 [Diplonema papillatum]|nr:hypothetical protein DIPPA_64938 [Diplonema papillatum]KAJ9443179.1 hypothetical protein DIPPA_64938 [Diplonema papillatum]
MAARGSERPGVLIGAGSSSKAVGFQAMVPQDDTMQSNSTHLEQRLAASPCISAQLSIPPSPPLSSNSSNPPSGSPPLRSAEGSPAGMPAQNPGGKRGSLLGRTDADDEKRAQRLSEALSDFSLPASQPPTTVACSPDGGRPSVSPRHFAGTSASSLVSAEQSPRLDARQGINSTPATSTSPSRVRDTRHSVNTDTTPLPDAAMPAQSSLHPHVVTTNVDARPGLPRAADTVQLPPSYHSASGVGNYDLHKQFSAGSDEDGSILWRSGVMPEIDGHANYYPAEGTSPLGSTSHAPSRIAFPGAVPVFSDITQRAHQAVTSPFFSFFANELVDRQRIIIQELEERTYFQGTLLQVQARIHHQQLREVEMKAHSDAFVVITAGQSLQNEVQKDCDEKSKPAQGSEKPVPRLTADTGQFSPMFSPASSFVHTPLRSCEIPPAQEPDTELPPLGGRAAQKDTVSAGEGQVPMRRASTVALPPPGLSILEPPADPSARRISGSTVNDAEALDDPDNTGSPSDAEKVAADPSKDHAGHSLHEKADGDSSVQVTEAEKRIHEEVVQCQTMVEAMIAPQQMEHTEAFESLQLEEFTDRKALEEDTWRGREILMQIALVWAWRLGSIRALDSVGSIGTPNQKNPDGRRLSKFSNSDSHPRRRPVAADNKTPPRTPSYASESVRSRTPNRSPTARVVSNAFHVMHGEIRHQGWLFMARGGADAVWIKRYFASIDGILHCGTTPQDPCPRVLLKTSALLAVEYDDRMKSLFSTGSLSAPPGGAQSFGFSLVLPPRDDMSQSPARSRSGAAERSPTPSSRIPRPPRTIRFSAPTSVARSAWMAALKDGMCRPHSFNSTSPPRERESESDETMFD